MSSNKSKDLKIITVYTDGSSTLLNKENKIRCGGVGVFFGDKNDNNISKSFIGNDVTNQRMELLACIEAINKCIEMMKDSTSKWSIKIITDSMYVIQCINDWAPNWILWGWKRKVNGKIKDDICNLDLIKRLYKLSKMYTVNYEHVNSHKKEPKDDEEKWKKWYGNNNADILAGFGTKIIKNGGKV